MRREKHQVQIFLAHANEDKDKVLALYRRLKEAGYKPWLDQEDLIAGQNWRQEIPRAIKGSDIFLACFSNHAATKEGYIQQELQEALIEYAKKPPNSLYLIPLKFEPCEVPDRSVPRLEIYLRDHHCLKFWEDEGFEKLLRALEYRRKQLEPLEQGSSTSQSPQPATPKSSPSTTQFVADSEPHVETVLVDATGKIIERKPGTASDDSVDLGNDVELEMVAIPGGIFTMGSPKNESQREDDEGPRRDVMVQPFFLGKYHVTQAQWKAMASFPKVERDLNPDPSRFKGSEHPVDNVSWHDAVEFCQRLSQKTGQNYRLPSEAEWEYACRAGTTTPFYCGETLTTELANYDGNYVYANGPKGEYRKTTTAVGRFPPNAFGLYDMHGNLYDWCQDVWHSNYDDAPTNGQAWVEGSNSDYRLLRGGSWNDNPGFCRSASRGGDLPGIRGSFFGFRVARVPKWQTILH